MAKAQPLISSLFGLGREQVQQFRQQQGAEFGDKMASLQANSSDATNWALAGRLGQGLVGAGLSLFGIEDPMAKRGEALNSVAQRTQAQLGDKVQDPSLFYPMLAKNLFEAGFSQEALQVTEEGQNKINEFAEVNANIEYKQSAGKYQQALIAAQEREANEAKITRQGRVAYGALNAFENDSLASDPAAADKFWSATIKRLDASGFDTSMMADLPVDQRKVALENIVNSSMSESNSAKQEIAAIKQIALMDKYAKDDEYRKNKSMYQDKILELREKALDEKISYNEKKHLLAQVNSLENKAEVEEKKKAGRERGYILQKVGLSESNKSVRQFLNSEIGLTREESVNYTSTFNALYRKYLTTYEDGYPKYDPYVAEEMAKDEIRSMVETDKGFFKDKVKLNTAPKKQAPIKLD